MFWDEEKARAFNGDFIWDGYRIIGDHQACFAVPINAETQYIERLFAGLKSYTAGLNSIDYTRKQYGMNWKFNEPSLSKEQQLIGSFISFSKKILDEILKRRKKLTNITGSFGLFAAGSALMRLDVTFSCICLFLFKGLSFETATLLRLVLEQIAWAYDVHNKSDEYVNGKSPTKTISTLKSVFPESGVIYGYLSKKAHIDPSIIRQVVDFPEEGPSVVFTNIELCINIGFYLVLITEWYAIITEYLYRGYFTDLMYIENTECIQLREKRYSTEILSEAYQLLNKYNDKR